MIQTNRISATIIERVIIYWGQIVALSCLFIFCILLFQADFSFRKMDTDFMGSTSIALIFVLILLGFIEYLILYLKFKELVSIRTGGGLFINRHRVEPKDLKEITPITYELGRVDYKLLELVFNNGTKKYALCKPQFILHDMLDKPNLTIRALKSEQPEFIPVIKAVKII